MVEVGIASGEAVFDWRSYLEGLDDLFETEEIMVQEKKKSIQEVIAEPEKARQKSTKVSSEKADEETMKWL